MKKITYTVIITILSISALFYYLLSNNEKISEYFRYKNEEEVFVYETPADSAGECISYENYDSENGVCYFECVDDKECKEINDSVEEELASWLTEEESSATEANVDSDTEQVIPSDDKSLVSEYKVSDGEVLKLNKGKAGKKDSEIWSSISKVSPDSLSDTYIDTFQVFDNEEDDTLAFVDDEDGDGKWRIGINLNGYETSNTRERNLTVAHELAHIITLNNNQLEYDYSECDSYSTEEGCSKKGSYLNLFVNKFWTVTDIEKSKKEKNNLYKENNFVTEYAATNPEEDMAESFAYFVINKESKNKKDSSLFRNNKINFYYDFSELEKIRKEMRNGISSNIVREKKLR